MPRLCLKRTDGECVLLLECGVRITTYRDNNGRLKLAIEAPEHITILREEIATEEEIQIWKDAQVIAI